VVAFVFPFVYAIDPETLISHDPGYIVILTPVLALLLTQVATTYPRGVGVLVLACLVSAVSLYRMDRFNQGTNAPTMAPRNLAPLIATLDHDRIDRLYADYRLAYALMFDTKERIIAAQSKFVRLTFADGQATPHPRPVRPLRAPFQNEVEAARHGFVFFTNGIGLARLVRHGYRRETIKGFVIFVPPPLAGA
jgi:hypothetical protein